MHHSLLLPSFSLPRACAVATLALAVLFSTGCVTSTEVKDIVAQSNAESVAAYGNRLVAEAGSPAALAPANAEGTAAPPDAIARLAAFVEQHPENKVTLNALLLRQAMHYVHAGSLELARATFERIDATQLRSARDQGLLAVREQLLWWRGVARISQPGVFAGNHRTEAERARDELLTRASLPETPEDLCDYLLEMRAHIGIKLAVDLIDRAAARALIEDSVNAYARNLGDPENRQLEAGRIDPATRPFDASTRRLLRIQVMLEALDQVWGREPEEHQPVFASAGGNAYYRRLRPR